MSEIFMRGRGFEHTISMNSSFIIQCHNLELGGLKMEDYDINGRYDMTSRECPFCLDKKGEYGDVHFYHPKEYKAGEPYYTNFKCTHSRRGCSIGAILFEVLNLAKKL